MKKSTVMLILANNGESLKGLITLISDRFHVIVHVDAKSNIDDFLLPEGTVLVQPRFPVFWGGFNMVLAIRAMIDAAYVNFPHFERLVTITGDTIPVVSLDELESRLADLSTEFMYLREVPDDPSLQGISWGDAVKREALIAWRFQNYVFSDDELHSPRSQMETQRKYNVSEGQAAHIRGDVQATTRAVIGHIPPRPKLFRNLYFGGSWWALSRAAIDLIIDDAHADINVAYFRYLNVPDEHFFQTLLGNKTRALASLGRSFQPKLVFVDYNHPERQLFTGDDFVSPEEILLAARNNWLFARKFKPRRTPELVAAIENGTYFQMYCRHAAA